MLWKGDFLLKKEKKPLVFGGLRTYIYGGNLNKQDPGAFRREQAFSTRKGECGMGRISAGVLIVALCIAGSAAGAVNLVIVEGDDCGWFAVDYTSDANISGLALDITVDVGVINDVNIQHVGLNDANGAGFGIFPAAFARVIDPNDPNWGENGYTPVADANNVGALGGLGASGITIECAALGAAAPKSGRLIEIQVTTDCTVCVTANATRGNVVLEGGADGGFVGPVCGLVTFPVGWYYPWCWDYSTQCNGDASANGTVDTVDWPVFRDGFGKSYPEPAYETNACGDFNRDGSIDTVDWPKFRDNFGGTPAANCPIGDINGIFGSGGCP